MTREETRQTLRMLEALGLRDSLSPDKLGAMLAYIEGKDIEMHSNKADSNSSWISTSEPEWRFVDVRYRVKPQPIRPYTVYELVEAIGRHGSNAIKHKITQIKNEITRLDFDDPFLVLALEGHEWISLKDLADSFTWPDGAPCGVKTNE